MLALRKLNENGFRPVEIVGIALVYLAWRWLVPEGDILLAGPVTPFVPLIASGVSAVGGWLAGRNKNQPAAATTQTGLQPMVSNLTDLAASLGKQAETAGTTAQDWQGRSTGYFDQASQALDVPTKFYEGVLSGEPGKAVEMASTDLGELARLRAQAKETILSGQRDSGQMYNLSTLPIWSAGQAAGLMQRSRAEARTALPQIAEIRAGMGSTAGGLGQGYSQLVAQLTGGQGNIWQAGIQSELLRQEIEARKKTANRSLLGSFISTVGGPILSAGLNKWGGGMSSSVNPYVVNSYPGMPGSQGDRM